MSGAELEGREEGGGEGEEGGEVVGGSREGVAVRVTTKIPSAGRRIVTGVDHRSPGVSSVRTRDISTTVTPTKARTRVRSTSRVGRHVYSVPYDTSSSGIP